MKSNDFVLDPLSAFAIQALGTIGHLFPEILESRVHTFSHFVMEVFLKKKVGIPNCRVKSIEASKELEPELVLKAAAFKAIARACTPSLGSDINPQHSGIQKLAEDCLSFIVSQE